MRKRDLETALEISRRSVDLLTRERNDLRRQLQRVRIAHESLHEAIYPDLHADKKSPPDVSWIEFDPLCRNQDPDVLTRMAGGQ